MATKTTPITINVGPLNGLGSLCLHVGPYLQEFNRCFREGITPEVEWDLRQVEAGEMSMAGLTAFLALAERMRRVSGHPASAKVQFKPRVFAFWDDVNFLDIARRHDLLKWTPPNIVGGYGQWAGLTNPNSMILAFLETADTTPDKRVDSTEWHAWKDRNRKFLTREFLARCGAIFDDRAQQRGSDSTLVEQVAKTAAELVLNSHYWGRSPAFVGLQRSTVGVTVAVCDVGRGFLSTLCDQVAEKRLSEPHNHIEAILLGCFLNQQDFGLRPAIDRIIKSGGWVTISSFDTEVRWGASLWERAKDLMSGRSKLKIWDVVSKLGGGVSRTPRDAADRSHGYWKQTSVGVRGVRIAFELPLSAGHT